MTGPRVTLADIEAEIAVEHYFNGHAAAATGMQVGCANEVTIRSLTCLTICVLTLHNGHKEVGINHGPVDPANFDAEMGRKYAREDAIAKLWNPLGFRLRDQMVRDELSRPALTEADAAADLAGTQRPDFGQAASSIDHAEEARRNEAAARMVKTVAANTGAEPSRVITPTVGRKVWFYPGNCQTPPAGFTTYPGDQACDATVVYVHNDRMVNLLVIDHIGRTYAVPSVRLVQPDDAEVDAASHRAEWMPYQVKQAGAA